MIPEFPCPYDNIHNSGDMESTRPTDEWAKEMCVYTHTSLCVIYPHTMTSCH